MAHYKARINGKDYPLKDGFIISQELNETLDSGTINFSIVNYELTDLETFDEVKVFDDSENPIITVKKQLVNKATDDIIAFTPTEDREYTIDTFSKTKLLERITLPNLTTTKILEGANVKRRNYTHDVNPKRNDGSITYTAPLLVGEKISQMPTIEIESGYKDDEQPFARVINYTESSIDYTIGGEFIDTIVSGQLSITAKKDSKPSQIKTVRVFGRAIDGIKTLTLQLEEGQTISDVSIEVYRPDQYNNPHALIRDYTEDGVINYAISEAQASKRVDGTITYTLHQDAVTRTITASVSGQSIEGTKTYIPTLQQDEYIYSATFTSFTRVNNNVNGAFAQITSFNADTGEIVYSGGQAILNQRIPATISYITEQIIEAHARDVYYYIYNYCQMYVPKLRRRKSGGTWQWETKYPLSNRIQAKFENVICPEFQWNPSTLREVLTDLMSVKNCIPIINDNNEIDYLDLSMDELAKNQIDTSKLTLIRHTITSEDYCTDLTINMKNALGKSKTRVVEHKSLRAVDSGEITSNNAVFTTDKPIYNIVSCVVSFQRLSPNHTGDKYYYKVDITDRIKEQQEWNILRTATAMYTATDEDVENSKLLKACNLHYKRGGNTIEGWGDTYNMRTDVSGAVRFTDASLFWVVMLTLRINGGDRSFTDGDVRNVDVVLTYETLDEESLHIGRYLPSKHENNKIFDNQTESYVDTEQQGIFEYIKVNRLSNAIKYCWGTYFVESEIPNLADTLGDYVLYSRKIEYLDGQFNFEGVLIKNFVLRDYFTGIQAKKRSWAIASGSEATKRTDIHKYYIEASFKAKNEILPSGELTINPADFLSSLLTNFEDENLKWSCLISTDKDGNLYPTKYGGGTVDRAYALDLHSNAIGKSVVFSFSFNDNYSAGDYVEIDGSTFLNQFYKYADDNGEFKKLKIVLTDYVKPEGTISFTYPNPPVNTATTISDTNYGHIVDLARDKPLISIKQGQTDLIHNNIIISKDLYKDQREIIAGSIQFEYCADTKDILLTDEFVKRNKFVATEYREKYDTSGLNPVGVLTDLEKFNVFQNVDGRPEPSEDNVGLYCLAHDFKNHGGSIWYYQCVLDEETYKWSDVAYAINVMFTYNDKVYLLKNDEQFYEQKGTPIRNDVVKDKLHLYVSNTPIRIYDMEFLPSDIAEATSDQWDYFVYNYPNKDNCAVFQISYYQFQAEYEYMYLCDENNKVLIACKHHFLKEVDRTLNIYFNVLKSRDTNIYDDSGNVVGTINEQ